MEQTYMNTPNNHIRNAAHGARLNEKGLNPETATAQDIEAGLRLVAGFFPIEVVPMVRFTEHAEKTRVDITVPNVSSALQQRLKEALAPITRQFHKGSVVAQWNDPSELGRYSYNLDTVICDIAPAQKPELLKALAGFINNEAAMEVEHYQAYGGKKPQLLGKISAIQNANAPQL